MSHSHKLLSSANATRRPPIRPVPRQVPTGFFDNVQDRNPPSVHRRRRDFAPSWGSRPLALLARIPSLFRRSRPNVDEPIELQQRPGPPGPTNSSHCSPHVVDVAAVVDREVIFVARRPETASEKAKRIRNPKPWVRVVLFLCCVSPGTDDGPGTNETHRGA
ncbi:hypothetical protein DFJ58DRAFT_802844 [Suillus subalutaceus]|uniref:uncharacterized protein n=1 Tax=Suillus subalutaceus TaxID=48586 RepID=UPI001B8664BA|nr:uncharacterized protein DFJ58DRAFT_802844 [Suillus subalutaceus]KAG1844332.1 hypothetical protein DFJ58DRAFT_802844 [Suillus subalutaceus]